MRYERLRTAVLPQVLSEVVADVADLFQKELRLARAEISDKIATKLHAGIWMSAAGILGLVTVLAMVQAIILLIASYGIALHWASLIVAGILAVLAASAFFSGWANAQETVVPTRAIHQINKDISTAKEQLT
jgi:Putative Actinobacterial Holin-X, holin superfamily III